MTMIRKTPTPTAHIHGFVYQTWLVVVVVDVTSVVGVVVCANARALHVNDATPARAG
jgi:hypothetical protein